jgi:fructose-1,6-bisphosphatase/sedoheptulose 1,7-bisphosphatase-like protein
MPTATTETWPDAIGRNFGLELLGVTEAAAIAVGQWVGMGDKNAADGAAVDAMRCFLSNVRFRSIVMRSQSGTIRKIDGEHHFDKWSQYGPPPTR